MANRNLTLALQGEDKPTVQGIVDSSLTGPSLSTVQGIVDSSLTGPSLSTVQGIVDSSLTGTSLSTVEGIIRANRLVEFDLGQHLVDETANRAAGVTYTNNTGKPIMVNVIAGSNATGGSYGKITVGGTLAALGGNRGSSTQSLYFSLTATVPHNSTYTYTNVNNAELIDWSELK